MELDVKFSDLDQSMELAAILAVLKGREGALAPALRRIGETVLLFVQENFEARGKRQGGWATPSAITAAFRPPGTGSSRVAFSWGDLQSIAAEIPILQDRGLLAKSFGLGGDKSDIFSVDETSITIGSAVPYAQDLQDGKPQTFELTGRNIARLVKRVPPIKSESPEGKARKTWNHFFFQLFNGLKKLVGKQLEMPARTMLWSDFNQEEMEEIVEAATFEVEQAVRDRMPPAEGGD